MSNNMRKERKSQRNGCRAKRKTAIRYAAHFAQRRVMRREVKGEAPQAFLQLHAAPSEKNYDKTFADMLESWLESNAVRLKGATVNKYRNLIDTHIKPTLGKLKPSDVTSTEINAFLASKLQNGNLKKEGGLSPSYVRSIMVVVNSAIKFAVAERICQPLTSSIHMPPDRKKEIAVLSIEEQRKLETYIREAPDPTKAGIFISLHTGLRIGEVCALSWDNVDFGNKIIKVRHTVARVRVSDATKAGATKWVIDTPKTPSSSRDIPIPQSLLTILETVRGRYSSAYVISASNEFISPRTYDYRYHRLLEESGVARVNYHALRHTFATRCIEAGVDVKSLSEILGHANVGITLNTYVHPSMELKRAQLEKLDAVLA